MNSVISLTPEAGAVRTSLPAPIIYVVDDDVSVRESLEALIADLGFEVATFATAGEFLDYPRRLAPSCLILDMRLPDINGLDVQGRIVAQRHRMPIIFITGYGDVPIVVRAMKAGAIEVLTKPIREDLLVRTILEAIGQSERALGDEVEAQSLRQRYAQLSPREREVMTLVVHGLLNKQVACELGISEITVKAHRGRVMRKMLARSFADLITMAGRLH